MKVGLIIDKPGECSECPVREIFFDSEWSIKQGVRHMSCRLNLDRATEVGKGIPAYCPLKSLPQRKKLDEESYGLIGMVNNAWAQGFNDCLDEIMEALNESNSSI